MIDLKERVSQLSLTEVFEILLTFSTTTAIVAIEGLYRMIESNTPDTISLVGFELITPVAASIIMTVWITSTKTPTK